MEKFSYETQFIMYVMFKPDSENSQWVFLSKRAWSGKWCARLVNQQGLWEIVNQQPKDPGEWVPHEAHVEWNGNVGVINIDDALTWPIVDCPDYCFN